MKFRKPKRVQPEEKWLIALSIAWGVAALIAGVSTLVAGRRRSSENPSKNAPQLKVDNPGIQADFPTAATESEVG